MRLAIMQPYLFPYLGYYQLLRAVDRFVIYDDVQFVLKSWVNRNNILVNGQPMLFTLPLADVSANRTIKANRVNAAVFPSWYNKFMRTLQQAYSKATYLSATMEIVNQVFVHAAEQSVAEVATESIRQVHAYLNVPGELIPTSSIYQNTQLSAQTRIIDICQKEGATDYVNAQGGRALYNRETFAQNGLNLYFLQPELLPYHQTGKGSFVSGLSIIDVLMNNSVEEASKLLNSYQLIS